MTSRLFIFLLITTIAASSCKKEIIPPVDETPIDPWAENMALIATGAEFYLIADVTGIPGVSKINWQLSTVPGAETTAYNGLCNGNECHTGYIVGHSVQPDYFWFVVFFQNSGPEGFTDMVHEGEYNFCTPADGVNGIDISFLDENYAEWRCKYLDNNAISASSFEVTAYELMNGATTIEARFNCTLEQYSGETITLSNAVYRAHW